jgi:hypothetical protein
MVSCDSSSWNVGEEPRKVPSPPATPSQFATPRLHMISGRKFEFPRLVNTSEKPSPPKFSKRVFVPALHLRSHTNHFIFNRRDLPLHSIARRDIIARSKGGYT